MRPAPLTAEGPTLRVGDEGELVMQLQRQLVSYGYGIEASGHYDERTRDVVTAFQRHFRPARVDGIADASTVRTLNALIKALPEHRKTNADEPAA